MESAKQHVEQLVVHAPEGSSENESTSPMSISYIDRLLNDLNDAEERYKREHEKRIDLSKHPSRKKITILDSHYQVFQKRYLLLVNEALEDW